MVAKPTTCIFCGGKPINEEHSWGQWLRAYYPPADKPGYKQLRVIEYRDRSDFQSLRRAGEAQRLVVKCVCSKCNSGWMGGIQNDTKPIVLPLIMGKPGILTPEKQLQIATWATMATITSEYDELKTVTIPASDREHFFKYKYPPKTFRIWVGHIPPNIWEHKWIHHPLAIAKDDAERDALADRALSKLNTETSTYVFGQFFIHVLSMSVDHIDILHDWQMPNGCHAALRQIWPMVHQNITWPPAISLDVDSASTAAGSFYNFCKRGEARRRARLGLPPTPTGF
jgi:hypothetical protein